MSALIWWLGAVHLVVYAVAGTVVVATILTVKLHMMFRVMGRIVQWHYARAIQRWHAERGTGIATPEPKP